MSEAQFQYDPALIRALRQMALEGKHPLDLIRFVQQREGYAPNFVVPVLGYLCQAFRVPLSIILPLREEMGVGPDSESLRVVFWFAAAVLEKDARPWDRGLFEKNFANGTNLEASRSEYGKLEGCIASSAAFGRGELAVIVAKELSDSTVRERINGFVREFFEMLAHQGNGTINNTPCRVLMDFRLTPEGPGTRITCVVQALREWNPQPEPLALASV